MEDDFPDTSQEYQVTIAYLDNLIKTL